MIRLWRDALTTELSDHNDFWETWTSGMFTVVESKKLDTDHLAIGKIRRSTWDKVPSMLLKPN